MNDYEPDKKKLEELIQEYDEAEAKTELNIQLHLREQDAHKAVERIERGLVGEGKVHKEDIIDLIDATENLRTFAEGVAQFEGITLEE